MWGLGFRLQGLHFRVEGSRCRVEFSGVPYPNGLSNPKP